MIYTKMINLIVSKENFKISKNNDSFKIIGKSLFFEEKEEFYKNIFIYTRSPAIIDRIGKYIYKKQLNKDDITLKLDNLKTKYSEDGGIENYHIKYFSCPELKEFKL